MATRRKKSPAVKFLWVIAILTMLFIAGAFGYRFFEKELMRFLKALPARRGRPSRRHGRGLANQRAI